MKKTSPSTTSKSTIDALVKQKLNDLLSPVDLHKVITLDEKRGMVFIGGEKADEGKLANLKAEADFILNSEIWQLIYETPKELAQRQMFVSSQTLDDLKMGKSILYVLSQQKRILEILKSYIPKK